METQFYNAFKTSSKLDVKFCLSVLAPGTKKFFAQGVIPDRKPDLNTIITGDKNFQTAEEALQGSKAKDV